MTFKEKLMQEHPDMINGSQFGGCYGCPFGYGYEEPDKGCCEPNNPGSVTNEVCTECWNREMPETEEIEDIKGDVFVTTLPYKPNTKKEKTMEYDGLCVAEFEQEAEPHILDSGDRTEFETGAVRDMREGKGRCDLLPLDVVSEYLAYAPNSLDDVIFSIYSFQKHGDVRSLYTSIAHFENERDWDGHTMLLEVAKHFEEGAKKYGDNNWRKGIPVRCYIDSAIRHYLKYLRGDKDEPHDRAFCWNILCAIWTCKHMPELNDYTKKEGDK